MTKQVGTCYALVLRTSLRLMQERGFIAEEYLKNTTLSIQLKLFDGNADDQEYYLTYRLWY